MYFCFQKGEIGAISEHFPFTKFFENAPQVSFVSFIIYVLLFSLRILYSLHDLLVP